MADNVLQIVFQPDATSAKDGWGAGALELSGMPYWYGDETSSGMLRWTWVDFLEFMAENWAALNVEQHYPYSWLTKEVMHPGQVWSVAERRWALLGSHPDVVMREETVVLDFLARHNLANAWKGLSLPQVLWMRVGQNVWLVPESGDPVLAPMGPIVAHLAAVGQAIADSMKGSTNPRVNRAIHLWDQRLRPSSNQLLPMITGWSTADLAIIQGKKAANDFWRFGDDDWWQETVLLAAARMLRFSLSAKDAGYVLALLSKLPVQPTPELNSASDACAMLLAEAGAPHPWEQGYLVANWLRKQLNLDIGKRCNPQRVLEDWNVLIDSGDLRNDHLEAIACWGSSGPAILLNRRPSAKVSTPNRLRTTLAHEIGHLLIDRKGALPAAEVLGGDVDPFAEQRAKAFAAELLLPRAGAAQAYQASSDLTQALDRLTRHYGVSRQVAAYQLRNSHCALGGGDEAELDHYVASIGLPAPVLVRG